MSFQNLPVLYGSISHWDSEPSGLLAVYGCEGVRAEYRVLSSSLRVPVGVYSARSPVLIELFMDCGWNRLNPSYRTLSKTII